MLRVHLVLRSVIVHYGLYIIYLLLFRFMLRLDRLEAIGRLEQR